MKIKCECCCIFKNNNDFYKGFYKCKECMIKEKKDNEIIKKNHLTLKNEIEKNILKDKNLRLKIKL